MEALKITGMIIAVALLYSYVNNEDYHSKFDNYKTIRYNCSNILKYNDVPPEVVEECQNTNRREVILYRVQ